MGGTASDDLETGPPPSTLAADGEASIAGELCLYGDVESRWQQFVVIDVVAVVAYKKLGVLMFKRILFNVDLLRAGMLVEVSIVTPGV